MNSFSSEGLYIYIYMNLILFKLTLKFNNACVIVLIINFNCNLYDIVRFLL